MNSEGEKRQRSKEEGLRRTFIVLGFVLLGMAGFCFALVPLYNTFCKITGLNGKTGGRIREVLTQPVDHSRTITLEFITHINGTLPWDFYPLQKSIKLHPGEIHQVAFYARNNTNKTVIAQAIPSISPGISARFLKKTECFCFTEQTLQPKESRNMPVRFYLDPDLPPEIHRMTLSYTLFERGGL